MSLGKFAVSILAVSLALGGCTSLGVRQVGVDRVDYVDKLRDSEKQQLLSNIVAMRYGDAPLFLNVTSVISQYTREASAHAGATVNPASDSDGDSVGGEVLLRETPTVTYTPITGGRFAHSMLSPLPPASMLAMMEAGWASDDLLRVGVRSINGVANTSHAALFEQKVDPRFEAVAAAFRRLQKSGAVSVRLKERDKAYAGSALVGPDLTDADRADLALLKDVLGLKFDGGETLVVFAKGGGPHELALATRSIFEILSELSLGVETSGGAGPADALIRVRSGARAPGDAYASVRYRGRWFWIDGADDRSRRIFLLTQLLLFLNDEEGSPHGPLLTIPAG
ncbi:MAG: hypothetical protein J7515_20540 [Caulobacter sp.]|nr:hypothetical protein [Caulobacter sp.]